MIPQRALRRAGQTIPAAVAATASSSNASSLNAGLCSQPASDLLPRNRRRQYTSSVRAPGHADTKSAISPRWLSETKARIGKCITFGMPGELVEEAAEILGILGRDWRELVAGSEGYLTSPKRAGLHRQRIVWGEQDSMGHVNNVMYVRYAESGRCNWILNYGEHPVLDEKEGKNGGAVVDLDPAHKRAWRELLTSRGIGLILKSITVDFKFPMTWPDRISVYHKLRARPDESSESLVLDVLIMSELRQRPAARCLEDVVVYDYRAAKKTTLEPFMLQQLRRTFDLQEKARRENHDRICQIDGRVRRLELQTWDRPDAKEDFGSASGR